MKKNGGFSLLELNLTIVVVGLLLPVVLSHFTGVSRAFGQNCLSYQATLIAKAKLEEYVCYYDFANTGQKLQNTEESTTEIIGAFICTTGQKEIVLSGVKGIEVSVVITHLKMEEDIKFYRFFSTPIPENEELEDENDD